MTSEFSWQNVVSLCPASFCTPRLNLPVTLGIDFLLEFLLLHYSPLWWKGHLFFFFLVLILQGIVGHHRTVQLHWLNGHELGQTPGDGEGQAWHAVVHGVMKSWTWLGDWTTTTYIFTSKERWVSRHCEQWGYDWDVGGSWAFQKKPADGKGEPRPRGEPHSQEPPLP